MHWVKAAQQAYKVLGWQLEKLEKQLGPEKVAGVVENDDDLQERQLEGIKEMIELIVMWPIRFYSIGGSYLSAEVEEDNDDLLDALQCQCQESPDHFTDILYRQLYSPPGPLTKWESLIGSNRILNMVCPYRPHMELTRRDGHCHGCM